MYINKNVMGITWNPHKHFFLNALLWAFCLYEIVSVAKGTMDDKKNPSGVPVFETYEY